MTNTGRGGWVLWVVLFGIGCEARSPASSPRPEVDGDTMTAPVRIGADTAVRAGGDAVPGTDPQGDAATDARPRDAQATDPDVGEPSAPRADGPLCPGCKPTPGGETGDFTDVPPDICHLEHLELDRQEALATGMVTALQLDAFADGLVLPALWSPAEGHVVTGYGDAPQLRLQVEPSDLFVLARREAIEAQDVDLCHDTLLIGARVTLQTDEGALTAAFEQASISVTIDAPPTLRALADASGFTGTLDLGLREGEPGAQLVARLEAYFLDAGLRGRTWLALRFDPDPEGDDGPPFYEEKLVELSWPDDGCEPDAEPLSDERAQDLLDLASEALSKSNPHATSNGPLSFSLGPRRSGGCQRIGSEDWATIPTSVRVHSQDGQLDAEVEVEVALIETPQLGLAFEFAGGPVPVDELDDRYGLSGVDLGDAPCGELSFDYLRDPYVGSVSGRLEIDALQCDGTDRESLDSRVFCAGCD